VFNRDDALTQPLPSLEAGDSLLEVVAEFARIEMEKKIRHVSFLRVLLAEIQRLGPQTKQVVREIFLPWEDRLANQLRLGQEQGLVRRGVDPEIVVDQLMGMIFIGAVRFEIAADYLPYERSAYLTACVEMVICMVSTGREEIQP
jgi:Tetracyclin repressor-like, C-terminal domain